MLVLGAALVLATPPEPTSPAAAVQQFEDARAADDWSRVWDLMCKAEQRAYGPEEQYLAANKGRPRLAEDRWLAGDSVPLEPFPDEAWRVSVTLDGSRTSIEHLVIRENGELRVCGDPQLLQEP